MSILSFLKKEQTVIKKETKSTSIITPVDGVLQREFQNFFNSMSSFYDKNALTYDQINLVRANPIVESKTELKVNNALGLNKAFDYAGVNKKVAKYCESFYKNFNSREFAKQVMYSKDFGVAVIFVEWKQNKIYKTTGLDHRLFTFNQDLTKGEIGDLIYNTENYTKKYPYNFITVFNNQDPQHIFGKSDLTSLYPLILFYNLLTKIEARYMRKAVIPAFAAIYDTDKDGIDKQQEADFLSNALSSIENGSGIALANVKNIYTFQENGQVNFNSTYERLHNVIAIKILGSDLTDSKKNGTQAQATVGSEYIQGNVKDIAKQIQDAENILIEWAVWAEFGQDYAVPNFVYDMEEPYSLEKFKFMKENNFAISLRQASKVFPIASSIVDKGDDVWYAQEVEDTKADDLADSSEIIDSKDSTTTKDAEDNTNVS